jgi:hypothetical protein
VNVHVVPSNDIEAQHHLLNPRGAGKHALVALVEDDVGRLIKAFESALSTCSCEHDR